MRVHKDNPVVPNLFITKNPINQNRETEKKYKEIKIERESMHNI